MRIKTGDRVIVIAGKDKGAKGVVTAADRKTGRLIVEGVNIRTMHKKPTQSNPEGGIEKVEGPIDGSNVMIIDGKDGKDMTVSKIGYRYETKANGNKNKVRYMKKNGQTL